MFREIKIKNIKIGKNNPFVLIAGPCVIESEKNCLESAGKIKKIASRFKVPFIFKSSFDKANRLSLDSYRGPGIEKGIAILRKVKEKFDLPILSDIHCREEIARVKDTLDIIQIPAFLSRQTDIVVEAAKTNKAINIKKGQFLAPWDVLPIIRKAESTGNKRILITERGACFGYNNLVSDLRSIAIMREFNYPVIYDATHSVQLPGGGGKCSAGQRQFVLPLSRAAVAFGCDGLFLEVHISPEEAKCDAQNMINLNELEDLIKQTTKIQEALR